MGCPSDFCFLGFCLYIIYLTCGGDVMIGDVLKRTRTIYNYKASEMSKLLEISPSYLSEIENGKKQPSLELLEKYAKIYGIKLSSLILLSENFDDAQKHDGGNALIRNLMMNLIRGLTPRAEEQVHENG